MYSLNTGVSGIFTKSTELSVARTKI